MDFDRTNFTPVPAFGFTEPKYRKVEKAEAARAEPQSPWPAEANKSAHSVG